MFSVSPRPEAAYAFLAGGSSEAAYFCIGSALLVATLRVTGLPQCRLTLGLTGSVVLPDLVPAVGGRADELLAR